MAVISSKQKLINPNKNPLKSEWEETFHVIVAPHSKLLNYPNSWPTYGRTRNRPDELTTGITRPTQAVGLSGFLERRWPRQASGTPTRSVFAIKRLTCSSVNYCSHAEQEFALNLLFLSVFIFFFTVCWDGCVTQNVSGCVDCLSIQYTSNVHTKETSRYRWCWPRWADIERT